jgi:hypothetical protein
MKIELTQNSAPVDGESRFPLVEMVDKAVVYQDESG